MNCTAVTRGRAPCSRGATHFGNLCGQHFAIRVRQDPAFAAEAAAAEAAHAQRIDRGRIVVARRQGAGAGAGADAAAEAARRVARERAVREREAEREILRAAEREAVRAREREADVIRERIEAARALQRVQNAALRERLVAGLAAPSTTLIVETANKIMHMWDEHHIEGYDVPKAYVCLTRHSILHAGFHALLLAAMNLRLQSIRDDGAAPFTNDNPAIAALATALEPFGAVELTQGDFGPFAVPYARRVAEEARRHAEEVQARLREEARIRAEEAAAHAAAQRAALQQRLREEPVVFERDPEDGINLRAFATDRQSVHRSSVQNATHKAVMALLARPVPEDMEALAEIVVVFQHPDLIRWADTQSKEMAVTELTNDYFNTEAFSVRYGDVVDRVWAFIREHVHRDTLQVRLAQEVCEGFRMCSNGKMARLVNVLQGFDETLETEAPKEVFQARIALLMKQPRSTREASARALFAEFNIPEAEHDVWLEPLLEEDEAPAAAATATGAGAGAGGAAAAAADIIVVD
jgi:hypothetical protein